jgi:hypothetical protein
VELSQGVGRRKVATQEQRLERDKKIDEQRIALELEKLEADGAIMFMNPKLHGCNRKGILEDHSGQYHGRIDGLSWWWFARKVVFEMRW